MPIAELPVAQWFSKCAPQTSTAASPGNLYVQILKPVPDKRNLELWVSPASCRKVFQVIMMPTQVGEPLVEPAMPTALFLGPSPSSVLASGLFMH